MPGKRNLRLAGHGIPGQAEEVVGVDRTALVHVQAPAAEAAALREDHALPSLLGDLDLRCERLRAVLHVLDRMENDGPA